MSLNMTNYSWHPARPSMLFRWPNVSILVDCALDMSSLNSYLPHIYSPVNYPLSNFEIDCIKKVREFCFIEGVPEVHPTPLHAIQPETIDYILISNWNSLVALPFYVYDTGFRGRIYATSAVIQFGRLIMEELIEFFARLTVEQADPIWKSQEIYSRFINPPFRNPAEWRNFYTKDVMNKVLSSIIPLSFKQTFTIAENITITPYCSAYQVGSCNWKIVSETCKIGCLTGTSDRTTHVKLAQLDRFKGLDMLCLTGLSCSEIDPASHAAKVREIAMETLKAGGNVLFPVLPTGFVFDLIELIIRSIDNTSGVSLDTPVYFISPVAKSSIAYANVNAEWLAEDRQNNIYIGTAPEEPFLHSQFIRNNRLKIYESLFEPFSKEIKTPCVMFCGHPSLRIGDAAHLLHLWGNDQKNCLLMTNPDFPLAEIYQPFEDLKIRAYYYPVDTRLTFADVNGKFLNDLKPAGVYVPEQYLVPYIPGKPDSSINYDPATPMFYDETLLVTNKRPKKRKIKVHPDVVKKLEAKPHPVDNNLNICSFNGWLSAYDGEYELEPAKPGSAVGGLRPKYTGRLSAEKLRSKLTQHNIDCIVEKIGEGVASVTIPCFDYARVQISKDGYNSKIMAPYRYRRSLMDIITSILTPVC